MNYVGFPLKNSQIKVMTDTRRNGTVMANTNMICATFKGSRGSFPLVGLNVVMLKKKIKWVIFMKTFEF